jgi:hypothetical protein
VTGAVVTIAMKQVEQPPPMAALLSGTYGLSWLAIGFGELSRRRLANGFKRQFVRNPMKQESGWMRQRTHPDLLEQKRTSCDACAPGYFSIPAANQG